MMLWKFCLYLIVVNTGFSRKLLHNPLRYNEENLSGLKEFADKICSGYDSDYIALTNEYVDDYLLNDWSIYIIKNNIDPALLSPFDASVNWHAHNAKAFLDQGWLQGLSTVRRSRNVILKKNYPYVKISIPLTIKSVTGGYSYYGKVTHIEAAGTVNATSIDSKFTIDIDINIINYRVSLDDFRLTSPGKITANFGGNFISRIPSILIDSLFPPLKSIFCSVLQEYVTDTLNAVFDKHNAMACSLSKSCPESSTAEEH